KEKKLNAKSLWEEIDKVKSVKAEGGQDFESWPLDLLADYIVKTHHRYSERQIQTLKPYLDKICQVHGGRHPELFEIKSIVDDLAGDIASHLKKEELILFPFIKKLVAAEEENKKPETSAGQSVGNPVDMMKHEHDDQGEAFRKIAALSNDFTPPQDACNTYRVTFGLLQEFEDDLHKHIHLENNILFPKAIKLEEKLSA